MGQAKQRGTFEQRKELAIKEWARVAQVKANLISRRASPKHTIMITQLWGYLQGQSYDHPTHHRRNPHLDRAGNTTDRRSETTGGAESGGYRESMKK